jgi:hypothetical protein
MAYTKYSFTGVSAGYFCCLGSDGNVWFNVNTGKFLRVTPAGVGTLFPSGAVFTQPGPMCLGSDGNVWAVNLLVNGQVFQCTPAGVVTTFTAPSPPAGGWFFSGICAGSDGNLWITHLDSVGTTSRILKLTPAGVFTAYAITGSKFGQVCSGPDGKLWVIDVAGGGGAVWSITTAGVATKHVLSTSLFTHTNAIDSGPSGDLWVTDANSGVWQVTTSGAGTHLNLTSQGFQGICDGVDGNLYLGVGSSAPTFDGPLWNMTPGGGFTDFPNGLGYSALPAGSVCLGGDDLLWTSDVNTGLVWKFAPPQLMQIVTVV